MKNEDDCVKEYSLKVEKNEQTQLSQEALTELQGCFEVTDQETLFLDCCPQLILSYCPLSSKSCMIKHIKALLNNNKKAIRAGNLEEVRMVQYKISQADDNYRRKLKGKLQQSRMREVWSGLVL